MLRAPEGASLVQLCEALGWQARTLRAALTRLRQVGHAVERGRSEGGVTTYRIMVDAVDAAAAAGGPPKPGNETAMDSGHDGEANGEGTAGGAPAREAASGPRGSAISPNAGART